MKPIRLLLSRASRFNNSSFAKATQMYGMFTFGSMLIALTMMGIYAGLRSQIASFHVAPNGAGSEDSNPHIYVSFPKTMTMPASNSFEISPPEVLYTPVPSYTAEAKKRHIEGNVILRIKVLSTGAVEVLNVEKGLGDGLDISAQQAAQAMKFKPATDREGNPVEWDGTAVVSFHLR